MKHLYMLIIMSVAVCVLCACSDKPDGTDSVNNSEMSNMMVVENIEALRNSDGKGYDLAITKGYYRSGDGCGFTYYKDTVMKNAKDDGGTVIVTNDGTRWRAQYSGPLPLKLFGAVGDGKTDDTEAIKRWLASLGKGDCGYASAGRYIFSETLSLKSVDNLCIRGDGSRMTYFIYNGENDSCDLITGGGDKILNGWSIEGINIDSNTRMKDGCALHLTNLKHTAKLRDVSCSTLDGKNGMNLYNGVYLEKCSLTDYIGFEINVQNEGIMISGSDKDDSSADISIDQGTIVGSKVGIHCGGGFGGLYIRQVLLYGNGEYGYLQDNSLANRGNREIFISDECVLDASHSCCAYINDTKSLQCTLQFNAFISGAGWIEPATPGIGLYIKSLPQGRISVGSTHIKHCKSDGIKLSDSSVYITVSEQTYLVGNAGYGINSAYGSKNIKNHSTMISNTSGNTNF